MGRIYRTLCNKRKWLVILTIFILVMNGLFSSTAYAAKPVRDRTAPSKPVNLQAVAVTDTSISLAWSAATDNVMVTGYDVYSNSSYVGSTTTTSYRLSGLMPASSYSIYIIAKDAAGNQSIASDTLRVTTATAIPTPTVTPLPTATPTPTAVPTSTVTPTPTATPLPTPTITPIPTLTPAPTASPIPTATPMPTTVPTQTTKLVGYYAAWAAYSGFTPDKVDATKLTHINYAFANIGSDFKITLGYPDVDPANITKLNALKQTNPNLKTIIAVGGWEWSGRFSDAALTDASRTTFADSCVAFLVKYGFDGVDIDWEYPVAGGLSTNTKRAEDKYNYTLLMQKLRDKLDVRGAIDGKHYILSFAGASGSWFVNNVELTKLAQIVDYANIMTYDIHGSWDQYTDLVAPLYNNSDSSPQYKDSVASGVSSWLNAGYPANKLILGVPFYGYIYKAASNVNNGLYQTYSGANAISYANIAANYLNAAGYTRYFHAESKAPWLFNGSTFITYEDEISIGYKTDFIKTKGLGGAMVWELSQDPNRVLLNALYNGLR